MPVEVGAGVCISPSATYLLSLMTSPALAISERPPREKGTAEGRLVVIVHGTMDRAASFGRLARRLPDCTILSYDRRGYADSAGITASARFDDHVDDFFAVLGERQAVAFGHSYGGDVVLAAAERRPDLVVSAAVYEAPMPWEPWWPSTPTSLKDHGGAVDGEAAAEGFMRRMLGDEIWQRLPARTRTQRRSEGPALLADIASIRTFPAFDPSRVSIPVVVGYGTASHDYHQQGAIELASQLPDAKLTPVEGADHGVHLGRPRDAANLVYAALDRACIKSPDPESR